MTSVKNMKSSTTKMTYILSLSLYSSQLTSSVSNAYYISPNKLSWNDANAYCHDICDSELASIHSIAQHQFISLQDALAIDTNYGDNNFWIGLSTTTVLNTTFSDYTYQWIDASPVDYTPESLLSSNIDNSTTTCIAIDISSSSAQWIHANCSEHRRFVCNTCDSRINRFVLINQHLRYNDAQRFCEENVSHSSLASVHNDAEFLQSKTLVRYDSSWHTFIGLNDLHSNDSHSILDGGGVRNFTWTDGTSYDYGVLPTKYYGEAPWKPEEPSNPPFGGEQCIAMYTERCWWNDVSCVGENAAQYTFLCNMPSEICYPQNWFIPTDSSWKIAGCDASGDADDDAEHVMLNTKQFVNSNGKLVVEYTFAVMAVSNGGGDGVVGERAHGVRIYDGDECDFYYFVYVSENWTISLGTQQHMLMQLQLNESAFQFGVYYRLRLTIKNRTMFTVEINDVTYIHQLQDASVTHVNNNRYDLSGYIGLHAHQIAVRVKSLYISGASIPASSLSDVGISSVPSCLTANPTLHPTVTPTTVPTVTPSNTPTIDPTAHTPTTYAPTINVAELDYCVTAVFQLTQPPAKLSLMVDRLTNITQSITLNTTNCSSSVHQQQSPASINLTVCTCTADDQRVLAQNLLHALPTVIAGTNYTISTSSNTTTITTTVSGSWSAPTEKILYVQNPPISDPTSSSTPDTFSLLWLGIFMMIGGIIMCLICIIFFLLCRIKTTEEVLCRDHRKCSDNKDVLDLDVTSAMAKVTDAPGPRAHRFVALPSSSSHSLVSLPMSSRVRSSITPIDEHLPHRGMHDAIELSVADEELSMVQAGDVDEDEDSDDENESLWDVRSARSNIEPEGVKNTTHTPQVKNSI